MKLEEQLVRIKGGWYQSGRIGLRLGEDILVGPTFWTPVLWENEEDPEFHKAHGLEKFEFKHSEETEK